MKKIIYSLLFAALFSACSTDFLDRNPLDKPSNEAFWRTEKDAMAAATGCYNGWFSMDEVIYADCASDNAYNPFTWEGWAVQAAGTATPAQITLPAEQKKADIGIAMGGVETDCR